MTTAELGDQYCMLGKYNESTVKLEVEVVEPELSIMKESVEALRSEGINVRACHMWCVLMTFIDSTGGVRSVAHRRLPQGE